MRFLVPALIIFVATSGCIGEVGDKTFTVPDDAPSTADGHTGDGYDLTVLVVDQNNTPLAGAAVVYFQGGGLSGEASTSGSVDCNGFTCSAQGGSVFWAAEVGNYDTIAGVRTGPDGKTTVDVEPSSSIHVASGDVRGMTTEVLADVTTGDAMTGGQVTIMLFPDRIQHTFTVTMPNDVGRAGVQQGSYASFPMVFDDEEWLHGSYAARILDLDTAIAWENGASSAADLYVGVGSDEGPIFEGDDEQNLEPGMHTERLSLRASDLSGYRGDLFARGYHVQTMTDWVSLGFSGTSVDVTVEATLKGSNIIIQ